MYIICKKRQFSNQFLYHKNLVACSSFNVNNHILLNTEVYRGRSVNDGNIQEFVSDLARKYIPSDLPQWQVIVIPTSLRASTLTRETEGSSEPVEVIVQKN